MSDKSLAQIGYEAAAKHTNCEQAWGVANQMKWTAAATAIAEELAHAVCWKCAQGKKIAFEEYLGKWDHGGQGGCLADELWMRAKGRPT